MGVGLCLGPLMGALVYSWLTYIQTFYFFTGYIFIVGIIAIVMIPARVNTVEKVEESKENATTAEYGITYKEIL